MKLNFTLPVLFLSFILLSFHSGTLPASRQRTLNQKTKATVLEGYVYLGKTTTPVEKVYLYIVEGEEEYLTGKNGYFRIESWQKPPFHITVKHSSKPAFRYKVTDPSIRQVIYLR